MFTGILFKNARLIHPDRVEPADLRIADGRIAAVGPNLQPQPGDEIQMLGWRFLKGRLKAGAAANFSILTDEGEVLATFIKGHRI